MIYATVNMTIGDYSSTCDNKILLYRGDKNVEIRIVMKGNKFTVLDSTYAQMIIKRPSATSVFSEPAPIQNNTVIFVITEDMIDELKEIGEYTFQIRLYDDTMTARATLPPCNSALIIERPIAVEGEAAVNLAMVNDSAVMPAADVDEEEIFTEDNKYNRTIWVDGDLITDARLNKIEDALYYINENGGNGGGGGATAPYISTELPETVMVGSDENFDLHLYFNSPNMGKGTLKVFINDVDSISIKIDQGDSTTVLPNNLFAKGTNRVVVYVLDRVGVMSNSLVFYIRYGSTEISSDFDPYSAYDYGSTIRYYFTPTALDTSLSLTFYMSIDDQVQQGVNCTSDTRGYYTFPTNLSADSHYCEAYVVDSNGVKSNILSFNLIILDADTLVVASDTKEVSIEEGGQLSLDYKVYMKYNTSFIANIYVDDVLVNTGACNADFNYYKTSSLTKGVHTVKLEVFDVTETHSDYITWTVTVLESTYEMLQPVNAGAMFIGTAVNKTNTDERKQYFIGHDQEGNEVLGTLTNFAYNSESGWVNDELIISGNSHVEIPVQPLANNAKYGFTLDIEFTSKQIGVPDAEVLTLWNDETNCGVKITTEKLILQSSNGNKCDLYFTDNEKTHVMFVIDRQELKAKIYLNGVMCEAFHLNDYTVEGVAYLDDFTVNSNIILGGLNTNGYCKIRNLRVYQVALTTDEIINNFISCEIDKAKQRALSEFQKGNDLPTLYVYCDFSGLGKDDKKPCKIVYNSTNEELYGKSFNLNHKQSQLQYQGTSSMAYPIKNYRLNLRDENGDKWYYTLPTAQPECRFTLKADFMSSGHWTNTGMAKFINDNLYNYDVNDEKSMNPFKWNHIQNGGKVNDFRETITGFPCRLILVNDGETPLNTGQNEPTPGNTKDMGIFNFNNDKDNVTTLGFNSDIFPNCASYEVTANSDTSAGAFMSFNKNLFKGVVFNIGLLLETGQMDTSGARANCRYTDYIPVKPDTDYIFNLGTMRQRSACYDANKNFLLYSNGTTFHTTSDTAYVVVSAHDSSWTATDTVTHKDGVLYEGTEIVEPTKEEELAYLKESFELRHPDEDDVAEDWGFMGVSEDKLAIDYFINNGSQIATVRFSPPSNTLTFGEKDNIVTVTCYSENNTWMGIGTWSGNTCTLLEDTKWIKILFANDDIESFTMNNQVYTFGSLEEDIVKEPTIKSILNKSYGLKTLIDWVDNCTDEEFVRDFEKHFHKDYTLRYFCLVTLIGAVDNLGKNMMLDTADNKIFFPRFYDIDTICSYDNSGQLKFDVDIEMEQGYWNTSSSRLWTRIRDLMHNDIVTTYNDMRKNGVSYENMMKYIYDEQIAKIPQAYYNKDYDVKYAPFADSYIGMAHGDTYEHVKRWLKQRFAFVDSLFDYAPSYNNDILTIRANTTELMTLEIETYTPVYLHLSWYNGQMDKKKIDGKVSVEFSGKAQTATDQEVLIYGGSNVKSIKGIQSANPNRLILGSATKLTELDASNCPLLYEINMNKANLSPHEYLNKVNLSNCPLLEGNLRLNNSPLIQELDIRGTNITGMNLPSSIRNLQVLKLPNTMTELTLNDAGMLHTLEFDEGVDLQSISMTNCNALTNVVNFDLLQTPSITLNNSYNSVAELYFRDTTNLSLSNMPNLERVIFTPNNEYETFEMINVANAPDYKVTTFNCPKLSTFMTTAPYRESFNNCGMKDKEVEGFIDTILVENYKPRGATFEYNLPEYDSKDTRILASIDISTCLDVDHGENILSIGRNLTDWFDDCTAHFYYIKSSNTLRIDLDNGVLKTIDNVSNPINIELNIIGLFINDEYIPNSEGRYVDNILKLTSLNIGSCEGTNRSNATYNYIKTSAKGMVTIQVKDYDNIQPNTTFTANSIDISSTKFTDVKLLCTTDTNTLKLPTTVKNFYCDSSFDLDTDYLEDGEYDVIHGELVEPYTTDYEVHRNKRVTESISWNAGNFNTIYPSISHGDNYSEKIYIQEDNEYTVSSSPSDSCGSWFKAFGFNNSDTVIWQYGGSSTSDTTGHTGTIPGGVVYVRFARVGGNPVVEITYTADATGEVQMIESKVKYTPLPNLTWTHTDYALGGDGAPYISSGCKITDFIEVTPSTTVSMIKRDGSNPNFQCLCYYDENKNHLYGANWLTTVSLPSNAHYIRFSHGTDIATNSNYILVYSQSLIYTPNLFPSSADGSLIFSMYAPSNTVAPASGTWDLKGLEFDNFHTFGMNNDVKPNEDSFVKIFKTNFRYNKGYTWGNISTNFAALLNSSMTNFNADAIGVLDGISLDIGDTLKIINFIANGEVNNTYGANIYRMRADCTHYNIGATGFAKPINNKPDVVASSEPLHVYFALFTANKNNTPITELTDIIIEVEITKSTGEVITNKIQLVNTEEYPSWPKFNTDIMDSIITRYESEELLQSITLYKGASSITMPARYDDYNITIKNARISPKTHNTMLYPLLVNEDNPITGTLDYTNYAGKHLSWSFAYTDEEYVNIIQPKDELLNSYEYKYNAFYDTEYEFDNPYEVARYTSNASGVLPSFDAKFTYTYDEMDNGDGTYTTKIYADSLDNLPTLISFLGRPIISVAKLNTSQARNLQGLFQSCAKLERVNTRYWDTTNVTTMGSMFRDCNKLTSIDLSSFDTSNVTNMSSMFYGCSGLTSLDLSGFDTSNVKNMDSMFRDCNKLTSIDVSGFDTSNVTIMINMFRDCNKLTSIDVSGFDTSNVTSIYGMFRGCRGLTSLDLSSFDVGAALSMFEMFRDCINLTSIDLSGFDTKNVTNMVEMFRDCNKLTSLDLSGFKTSNVTNMSSMFQNCSSLMEIKGIEDFNVNLVSNFTSIFSGTKLTVLDLSTWTPSNYTQNWAWGYAFSITTLTSLDLSSADFANLTDLNNMFNNAVSLVSFNPPINIAGSLNLDGTKLDTESLIKVINNLATVTTSQTLTLGSTLLAKLTEDQIAIATNKGWTVA